MQNNDSAKRNTTVIPRCSPGDDFFLFRLISERENPEESYALEMSVCEIYNNEVRDLLAGKNASRVRKMDWVWSGRLTRALLKISPHLRNTVRNFQVTLCLCFKTSLRAESSLHVTMSLIDMKMNLRNTFSYEWFHTNGQRQKAIWKWPVINTLNLIVAVLSFRFLLQSSRLDVFFNIRLFDV